MQKQLKKIHEIQSNLRDSYGREMGDRFTSLNGDVRICPFDVKAWHVFLIYDIFSRLVFVVIVHVTLVAITGTTLLVPDCQIKSL